MKKTVFTLLLMIASAVAVNAQSLTSNPWYTTIDLDGEQAVFVLNFQDNGMCALAIAADHQMNEDGMKITVSISAVVSGTYKFTGKNLDINLDKDNADVDIDYEIEGIDASTKKMMDAMIRPELEKQKPTLKDDLFKNVPKMGNMKVVSVSREKLVIASETGEEKVFFPTPNE